MIYDLKSCNVYHHFHHRHLSSSSSLSSSFLSPCGIRCDPGVSVSPASCLKEVIESATLNPLCYPNSYWAEL